MADHERRRHKRVKIDKSVTVRNGEDDYNGRVVDISTSGAAVSMDDTDYVVEDDQDLELDFDEFGTLPGNVVRTLEDGFAMSFDLDEEGEDRLISEITGFQTGHYTD